MTHAVVGAATLLSTLEFDVVWEAEQLGSRHVALDVPRPGTPPDTMPTRPTSASGTVAG
jgi:hypothetical protein